MLSCLLTPFCYTLRTIAVEMHYIRAFQKTAEKKVFSYFFQYFKVNARSEDIIFSQNFFYGFSYL